MKKKLKLFIVYFPIILVSCQVLINLLYFVERSWYMATGFYLNTFFGTNVLFALFLLAFTFTFDFCSVSKWAAIAEVLFSLNYLVIQEDGLYNISFQVIVGLIALMLTSRHYMKKFPLCRVSLVWAFIVSVVSKGSCEKGLEKWERDIKKIILRNHEATRRTYS